MKSFKKSLKSMNFILLGPWAEKKSGRESSGGALGELWEISGKPFPPEVFLQRVRESSGKALPDLSQSSPKVLPELSLTLWRTNFGRAGF